VETARVSWHLVKTIVVVVLAGSKKRIKEIFALQED